MAEPFDAAATELSTGVNLIEAGAGTGKTYAIAMLALRFVAEFGLSLDELLVVTFTKAATEELKDRIRRRLMDARAALDGESAGVDGPLRRWVEALPVDCTVARQRIELALLDIDQAGIFTIHGFCQRVLREHALESGELFDSELTGDIDAIRQELADDFWRTRVYGLKPLAVSVLMSRYPTPGALLASVGRIDRHALIAPDSVDLDAAIDGLMNAAKSARAGFDEIARRLEQALDEGVFNEKSYEREVKTRRQALADWLGGEPGRFPTSALQSFTLDGIKAGLNGTQFRASKQQTGDQRKQAYIDERGIDTAPFDQLSACADRLFVAFRRALVDALRDTLEQRLRQRNVLSYDDLILRLANALEGSGRDHLVRSLRERYRAALIDEFQDTDQAQWRIFSTLFDSERHWLFLIGDPKQAIYRFRGADIHSYFAARDTARHRFTLTRNWRSHPDLVEAVNALFSVRREGRPFLFDQLEFNQAVPALTSGQGVLCDGDNGLAPMVLWQLAPKPDGKTHWWSVKDGKRVERTIRNAVVNEIVRMLDRSQPVRVVAEGRDEPVRPKDIAVLVRTNEQAREYQAALKQAAVPSVRNSTDSVFATKEAQDLLSVMEAVLHAGDVERLKQVLVLDWFGLDGQALYRAVDDEALLDGWLSRFQDGHTLWQEHGFMAMMRRLLDREGVQSRLARLPDAERRLTDLHHLIELVQQAAADEHLGPHKCVDWLHSQIVAGQGRADDERQLRLESDEEAVQIVTMHRAKGLEYRIVFCPVLWKPGRRDSGNEWVQCHEQDGGLVVDLGSDQIQRRRERALREQLAEELRLLYVAVTRARLRCYLVWADLRTKDRPNGSALAYLLHTDRCDDWESEMAELDFDAQQQRLLRLRDRFPRSFEYRRIDDPVEIAGHFAAPTHPQTLNALERRRALHSDWQMSSYTALAALSVKDVPELPRDMAQEVTANDAPGTDDMLALPKGSHTGHVVHELLEKSAFGSLAEGEVDADLRERVCRRYGLTLERPERLDDLLQQVVRTPLSADDPAFHLSALDECRCLKEMPFYLAIGTAATARVNAVLGDSAGFRPLHEKTLEGYLTGFIDLVCEYRGRFYVMDYKTNGLVDYQQDTLVEAMRMHNYGLQYWIYTLVLDRYLALRIADYDYDRHFGGVRYLFVRGMDSARPMSGVYADRPQRQRLDALAAALGLGAAPCRSPEHAS